MGWSAGNTRKDEIAQEMFDKKFDELEPRDRQRVGGKVGGELRGGDPRPCAAST